MTEQNVLLKLHTVQMVPGEKPEVMELQTEGLLREYPDRVEISYVETQLTGLEGVETTFAVYGKEKVVLSRHGEKLNNEMVFILGEKTDSLYDVGFGALMISVSATAIDMDLYRGEFRVEYTVEVEHTFMGTNTYFVSFRKI